MAKSIKTLNPPPAKKKAPAKKRGIVSNQRRLLQAIKKVEEHSKNCELIQKGLESKINSYEKFVKALDADHSAMVRDVVKVRSDIAFAVKLHSESYRRFSKEAEEIVGNAIEKICKDLKKDDPEPDDLLDCPFCQSPDSAIATVTTKEAGVEEYQGACLDCFSAGPIVESRKLAAALWNRLPRKSNEATRLISSVQDQAKQASDRARIDSNENA